MNIACFSLEPWEKEVFQQAFPNDKIIFFSGKLTKDSIKKAKDAEIISVFIDSVVSKKMIDKLSKLKLITTRSTGFDHIDVNTCIQKGISVSNVPVYGENTVAEHTFALMLGLSRKLIDCVERTRKGSFELEGLRGFDLRSKTLGIIGCGNIGQHVARIAQGFEMNVLVYDVNKNQSLAKDLGFKYATVEQLLQQSDIVTLHVPYNKHTHHLMDISKFNLMKKGAYLINTSRGGIVDTDALIASLKTQKLAGAGLDVLEEENHMCEEVALLSKEKIKECNLKTIVENHLLLEMPNVLITPHNAFNTKEALMRILQTTIETMKAFKKGKKINLVSR